MPSGSSCSRGFPVHAKTVVSGRRRLARVSRRDNAFVLGGSVRSSSRINVAASGFRVRTRSTRAVWDEFRYSGASYFRSVARTALRFVGARPRGPHGHIPRRRISGVHALRSSDPGEMPTTSACVVRQSVVAGALSLLGHAGTEKLVTSTSRCYTVRAATSHRPADFDVSVRRNRARTHRRIPRQVHDSTAWT